MARLDPPVKKKSSCLGKIIKGVLIVFGLLIALGVLAAILPKKKATVSPASKASSIILAPTFTPTSVDAPPTPPPATPAPAAAPVAQLTRCLDVPAGKIDAIATALKVDGGGTLDPATAKAVQSKDYQKAFFIAAAIHGSGMGDKGQIGVWVSNDLAADKGMIFAVNAMAVEFSGWGDGSKTDAQFSMASDGASDAERCTTQAQGD